MFLTRLSKKITDFSNTLSKTDILFGAMILAYANYTACSHITQRLGPNPQKLDLKTPADLAFFLLFTGYFMQGIQNNRAENAIAPIADQYSKTIRLIFPATLSILYMIYGVKAYREYTEQPSLHPEKPNDGAITKLFCLIIGPLLTLYMVDDMDHGREDLRQARAMYQNQMERERERKEKETAAVFKSAMEKNPLQSRLDALEEKTETPSQFQCPITQDLMQDPVATTAHQQYRGEVLTKQIYEKTVIEHWLKDRGTDPKTGLTLISKTLTPQPALKKEIQDWLNQLETDALEKTNAASHGKSN